MIHKMRFTAQKIAAHLSIIEPLVYRRQELLAPMAIHELPGPDAAPLAAIDIDDSSWQKLEPGTCWGRMDLNFTMRNSFRVPQEWPAENVALYLPLGDARDFSHPETLMYIDAKPLAGCDLNHQEITLPKTYCDGKPHKLALHGWTATSWHVENRLVMGQCAVVLIDRPTREFATLARVALETIYLLADIEPAKHKLLSALDDAFKVLDLRPPFDDRFYENIPRALDILTGGIEASGNPLDVGITAVGHCHIDIAWLWTLAQSRRKAGRSFHTVIKLMEESEQYKFSQSQPQLYEYIRQDYPELFEKIKAKVAEGRWETLGGMWVEADCNITGPESLARQFLLGRLFFAKHFGPDAESPILWLPDVFGYAFCLPQLMKLAGIKYFFTTKIFWNQYNRMPYESFWWQGIDGTKILTHFGSTPSQTTKTLLCTYNGLANPRDLYETWQNFQQKESQQDLMISFGYGDGGGGPNREMLENIRVLGSFPAMPKVNHGKAIDFFEKMDKVADKLPTWNSELYLEYHRGTYTTQSRNKRANRKAEFALHDAEFLASYASLFDKTFVYPHDKFETAWRLVCLNQFHDIIPGSSIGAVYKDSLEQYETVFALVSEIKKDALAAISKQMPGPLVINPTSFNRSEVVLAAAPLAKGLTQQVDEGTLVAVENIPPYSAVELDKAVCPKRETGLSASTRHLENDFIRFEFNSDGDICRIYDKRAAREVLAPGAVANQFQAFEDRPLNWDAWDISIYYEDKMYLAEPAESIKLVEQGPLRAMLEIKRRILQSPYTQRISLNYNSPQLDIANTIDWQQKCTLLKAAFPVEVSALESTCEIQWGSVKRPTHRNTSWDWARFEVCAQKWVDLSEGDYGVSLLNDCKYGHDIKDSTIRISLLRSPINPDPNADQGRHSFTYSILCHAGPVGPETIAAAYALNDPLIFETGDKPQSIRNDRQALTRSLIKADRDNIIIETIKLAEDGDGIIVRLYESMRCRGTVKIAAGIDIESCSVTDLLERDLYKVDVKDNTAELKFKPFEIQTIRIRFKL